MLQTATVYFPMLDISGAILPNNGKPGLIVYEDGFRLGEAILCYGCDLAGSSSLSQADPNARTRHQTGQHPRV